MSADLDSTYGKMRQASKHLRSLKEELRIFLEREPVTLTSHRNRERTEEWWITNFREPIPEVVPLLIGDIAHNLRTALDHLVYALALLKGRPHSSTQFPITKSREKFYEKLKQPKRAARPFSPSSGMSKITGLTPVAQALIEQAQPYHGGDSVLLLMLASMDNGDKHRLLIPTFAIPDYWTHGAQPGTDLRVLRYALKDRAPFAKVTYDPDCTEVDVQLGLTPQIGFVFTDGGVREASDMMRWLAITVEQVIWKARPIAGYPNPPGPSAEEIHARQDHWRLTGTAD